MESTKQMKIVHSTHDAATRGRSTQPRPRSATQKVKDYFSTKIRGSSLPTRGEEGDEQVLTQAEPKIRERRASETQVGSEPSLCAFLMKEHKELKRKQREQRMYEASKERINRANEKASAQSRREISGKKPAKMEEKGYVQLQETPADEYMERKRAQRQAMREGKLEKVIPPSPPAQNPKPPAERQNLAPKRPAHKKSASTSSKLSSYMGTSADLLDATRRDLTSNLRKSAGDAGKLLSSKFDQLGRYSAGHGNNWDDESDSDESFCCVGERRLSDLDNARRLSGGGTDPWIEPAAVECRLCRKPNPAGLRGLCRACENEFRRPRTKFFGDSEDEAKPPAPLKVKKTRTASEDSKVKIETAHGSRSDENAPFAKFKEAEKKVQLVTPMNHIAQQVRVEDGSHTPGSDSDYYVSKWERWQSPDVRAHYDSADNEASRWSPRLLEDDLASSTPPSLLSKFNKARQPSVVDEDTDPLIPKEEKQRKDKTGTDDTKRSDSFYEYWDEVLRDDDANAIKRDNKYRRL